MHYPVGCGYEKRKDGYFDQLTAEETKTRYFRGYAEKHYEKLRDRNEALDLRVYFLAAVDILNPAVKFIKAELLKKQKLKRITDAEYKQITAPVSVQAIIKPEPDKPVNQKRFSMRNKLF
jgi:phage terminase large subunit GpA-like protein